MNRKLLAVLGLCAALMLSACQSAQKSAAEARPPEVNETPEIEEAPIDTPEFDEVPIDTPEVGEEAEAETVFAPLVGTWTADEGMGILTVYQNGGFLMDADDTMEGYLVYTDADGEAWESGPRYELYLENNERVPNCYFAFDDAHPGKLAYVVGGGAELFSLTNAAYDDDGVIFRVQFTEGSMYGENQDEPEIIFSTERVLPDFKLLQIAWVDSDVNDSFLSFSIVEESNALDALTPENPLTVHTSFIGDMPTDGVSFTDSDGVTRYFALLQSGYNGALVLTPFELSE